MPHYGSIKSESLYAEPHLVGKISLCFATCIAQIRLGYPVLFNRGNWFKLGQNLDLPCRFCGETESLYHMIEACPGYTDDRKLFMPEMEENSDILVYLFGPEGSIDRHGNVYFF